MSRASTALTELERLNMRASYVRSGCLSDVKLMLMNARAAKKALRHMVSLGARYDFLRCAWFALALITLSGCSRMAMLVKPEPYNAQVSPDCLIPCDPPMDLSDGDANTLLAVSKVNRAYLVRCSVRRDACGQAIDRLKQAKVIQ